MIVDFYDYYFVSRKGLFINNLRKNLLWPASSAELNYCSERKIAKQLASPLYLPANIVEVVDSRQVQVEQFIAMTSLCDLGSLRKILKKISLREVLISYVLYYV